MWNTFNQLTKVSYYIQQRSLQAESSLLESSGTALESSWKSKENCAFTVSLKGHGTFLSQQNNYSSYCSFSGPKTGRCVASDRETQMHVCEIYSWCPVEIDELPMPGFNIRLGRTPFFNLDL